MAEFDNSKFLLGRIKEVKGNASIPASTDSRLIVLFCSTDGDFEAVPENLTVSKVYPKVKDLYRSWWRRQKNFKGGEIQIEQIQTNTEVAYLLTCIETENIVGFDLEHTKSAIDKIGRYCSKEKRSIHVNKIGTENEWNTILELLTQYAAKRGVNIFIYSP